MAKKMTLVLMTIMLLIECGGLFPAVAAGAEPQQALSLGMVLYTDAATQDRSIQPLARFIEQQTGYQVKVRFFHDYYSIMTEIDNESLDLAILSPIVYAICREDPSLSYLATTLEKGKPFYHAILLGRKDGAVRTVADLAGKAIAFVDPYSASGHVFPAVHMQRQGLFTNGAPTYKREFLGSHQKALRALLEGRVEAAATFDSFFLHSGNTVGDRQNIGLQDFRVLAHFPERIPNDALVCRTDLGAKVLANLREALERFNRERSGSDPALKDVIYSGFVFDRDSGYDEVREFLKLAGVDAPATREAH